MRSTRLAEAEDCEDDGMKRIVAAKEGENKIYQGEEKKKTDSGAPHRVAALTALQRGS